VIDAPEELEDIPQRRARSVERPNDETIVVRGPFPRQDEWIVVKEAYFPRWRAQQGSTELKVYQSNLGTMLVQARGTGDITLKYDNTVLEKTLAFIALILLVGIYSLTLYSFRPKKPKKEVLHLEDS
jgi:uncharacterized membrane protein